jgi:serine/threonine protein phosphatase PrpC
VTQRGTGLTDVGRRRAVNEDAFLCDDALGLYVVADGMGGHAAGEIASQEAVETVHGMVQREGDALKVMETADDAASPAFHRAVRVLESAVQAATYMVFGLAQHDPEHHGMGTTVSALLLRGRYGIIAQVGDSRVYLVRDGEASTLTEDHTLVAWQVRQGLISADEASRSPHRNVITRAVGSREYVQVDTHIIEPRAGDTYLLCSDGLHGYLDTEEIPPICDLGGTLATKRFVELANERGGRDNITVIVVEVG